MAIKVKHEGSTASRLAAAAQGGAAKRAMEAAALAKPAQIQTLQAAHASAPGISTPHAQLIGAPGGGAHAGLIGGGGGIGARLGGGRRGTSGTDVGSGSRRVVRGSGDALDGDYKVTGTSIFDRPDDESVWNDQTRQWIRPWLPGEKEAEATRRVGEVQNELTAERELTAQGRRERAALVEDVVNSIKAGRFSREELPALMEQFSGAEDMIKMADALREREPTAEEAFRKSTFTDQNGVVFGRDGKMLYNPNDAMMKQAEYEAKRLDALKARADKFELELRKPYKVTVGEGDAAIEQMQMRDDEEVERIMKRRFPELYPRPPAESAQPTAQPVSEPTARKKKWDGFAD